MFGEWYRERDFYIVREDYEYTHEVVFKNSSTSIILKRIAIRYSDLYSKGQTQICLFHTFSHKEEIRSLSKKYFGELCKEYPSQVIISFKTPLEWDLHQKSLFDLLNYLNKKYDRQEFTKPLQEDILTVFQFILSNFKSLNKRHIIPEELPEKAHINPLRKTSKDLVNYLMFSENPKSSVIFDMLRQGEDPNQTSASGSNPLYYAIIKMTEKEVKCLVWYGADFKRRPYKGAIYDDNAIELCKIHNHLDKFNVFLHASTPLRKSLSDSRFRVKNISITIKDREIITSLNFPNDKGILLRLMTSEAFHEHKNAKEREIIFQLFSKIFKDREDNEKIFKEGFDNNFSPEKNKWIEPVIEQPENQIIGFSVFRVLLRKGKLAFKCEYTAFDEVCMLRGSGGNAWIPFRGSIALRCLLSQQITTKIHYINIHYFSWAFLKGELITGKYLSETMLDDDQAQVDQEFNGEVQIQNGCFIEARCLPEVRSSSRKRVLSFDESCYNEFILGGNRHRAAVVSTIVGKRLFKNLSEKVTTVFGFDFGQHSIELAKALKKCRHDFLPLLNNLELYRDEALTLNSLEDERWAFWTGMSNHTQSGTQTVSSTKQSRTFLRSRL